MFWGMPSAGRGMLGWVERRAPALQFPLFAGGGDALLDVADRVEIFVQLALIGRADLAAQVAGVFQHGVQHALVAALDAVLEEPVEGQGRIDFQRRGRGRRRPGDVRAVEHRIVFVDRGVGLFAAQHQARHLGLMAMALGHELVEAGAGANFAPGGQRRAGQQVAGLRAVDVALRGLLVVQAADEEHLFAQVAERSQHLAQLQTAALPLGPPLAAMKAVAREQHRQAHRSGAGRLAAAGLVTPDAERLEPGQGHADAQSAEHRATGKQMGVHGWISEGRWFFRAVGS